MSEWKKIISHLRVLIISSNIPLKYKTRKVKIKSAILSFFFFFLIKNNYIQERWEGSELFLL